MLTRLVICSLMLCATTAMADRIYTWKDKNGITQYGDQPVNEDAKSFNVNSNVNADPFLQKRNQNRKKILKNYYQHQQQNATKQKEMESYNNTSKQRCQRTKDNLARYQVSKVLYKNDGGKRTRLGADEYQNAVSEAKNYIAKWCQE